jgi:hypothetical protein
VFKYSPELIEDPVRLDEAFDQEANWVAYRCNLHSCGPTCVKYSFKKREGTSNGALCRFKAPWKKYDKTEFTEDGLFHVARNHSRVNRYNKALSVGLRHNIDVTFLPTNLSGLAMIFYSTNYSTKLDAPLWKRAALIGAIFDGLASEKHAEDEVDRLEVGGKLQRKNGCHAYVKFMFQNARRTGSFGCTVRKVWRQNFKSAHNPKSAHSVVEQAQSLSRGQPVLVASCTL